jgi:hypothetical protein
MKWLLDSDPAIRLQVMRDLNSTPPLHLWQGTRRRQEKPLEHAARHARIEVAYRKDRAHHGRGLRITARATRSVNVRVIRER